MVATNQADLGTDRFAVQLLNANWQFSWSHDLDALALAAGLFAAVTGARWTDRHRGLWGATALIIGLFFLDEISPLHSEIDRLAFGKLLYSPILVALVICVWLLTAETSQRAIVGVGLVTLFLSFGMHVVGLRALLTLGYYSWPYQAGVGVKSGTELAGLLLVVPGLWRLARPGVHRRPNQT